MARPEKVAVADQMAEKMKSADAIFVADFNGLNVAEMTELRVKLREASASLHVAKNTFLRRAAGDADLEGLLKAFEGPSAIAFSNGDPAVCAKVFHEFYTRLEKPRVKVFWVDGRYHGDGELKSLADLPPRDVLLSMVVAAVEAPISSLVGTLDSIIRELIGSVDAIAEKRKAESAA